MKALPDALRRFSLTGLMVALALWAGYRLWDYYFDAPWTRDGHIRADSNGQREDGCHGEGGCSGQSTKSVARIL